MSETVPTMVWDIDVAGIKDVATFGPLMKAGWEPFAVSDGRIYFRKQIPNPATKAGEKEG